MRIEEALITVILFLNAVRSSSASVCYAGQIFDASLNSARWVLPVTEPCRCTAVRPGGVLTTAPLLSVAPVDRGGGLLFSEVAEEFLTLFNCKAASCATLPGPGHWKTFDHCYLIVKQRLSYEEAESHCQELSQPGRSAHLASILSAAENAFLLQYNAAALPQSNFAVWIGYDRLSLDKYQWVDGSNGSGFTDWSPGEPTGGVEKCAVLWYGVHWNDWGCYNIAPFVCKMPAQ
ncbi:snaclec EMS16 subunit alpha-like [Acanthaster planci]|uniref:Snaclec EMS16 subunit alpha-like n=1 Tax=Acanthaster planci TaxID=133434 RepID=A0A8B7YUG0_ACAPL|nr:snaclec EMS16 subunit alpha-like [Acanthaster planci]